MSTVPAPSSPTKNPPNQRDKRQANKQNKTLITDYTTRQHKKCGGSDGQQMTPPARGRSQRRQNRAHSTRDDSLKHRRSPTGDTPRHTDEHVSKRWPSNRVTKTVPVRSGGRTARELHVSSSLIIIIIIHNTSVAQCP